MKKEKKSISMKKKKAIIISSLIILTVLGVSFYGFSVNKKVLSWSDKVYPNVSVENVDLSGKSKDEAIKLLTEKYGEAILKKQLSVKAMNNIYKMDYSKLNAKYNIEEVVNQAFDYGKNLSMLKKYNLIKRGPSNNIELKFNYSPEYINEFVAEVAKNTNKAPQNAKIKSLGNGKFDITEDKLGYKLDEEQLKTSITENINGKVDEDITLEAKVDEVKAKVLASELNKVNSKIASFSTDYSQNSTNERAYNVELATKAINGTVLMPGDTFSYNEVVGERTVAKGYKDAPIIVGNKVESGLGGGICQVSSTLYQAVIRTGLKSVERYNHSLPTSYVPKGLDATVVYGNLDYKFKNTYDFPIFIEGITQNRKLYFNIYGNASLEGKTYEISTEVYETIAPNVKTVDDPELPEGQTVVEKNAVNGYKVKVYRKTYENGNLINTEFISNDTYQPMEGVVRRGTKKE